MATSSGTEPELLLRAMFDAAVASALPDRVLARLLPEPPVGRTIVIGAGKASASMARALEAQWQGNLSGLVVTRYGHAVECRHIEVVEAGHPIPDSAGEDATARMIALLDDVTEDDLVIALISGGGSALLVGRPPDVSFDDERQLIADLLASGATIAEMNCLRKHVSTVKGGRLAIAAAPARLVTFVISDVPGDDPATIASGPTVADPTTRVQAIDVVARYSLTPAPSIMRWLDDPASETPKPGEFAEGPCHIIAAPQMALDAAAALARRHGYTPVILGDAIEGEARDVAKVHAGIARQIRRHGQPQPAPCVLLSGGETTVTIKGRGRGGRNAEFLLALAIELAGAEGVHALAADTDGIDGSEDNAGAVIGPDILSRGRDCGASAANHLAANDAYGFFSTTGSLVMTGPTHTNVNDFRAILVDEVRPRGDCRT